MFSLFYDMEGKKVCRCVATFLLLAWMWCAVAVAQKSREQLGGVYYAYPHLTVPSSVPAGYEPVFLSHYGRHGSRWLTTESRYEWILSQFADADNLTEQGRRMCRMVRKACRQARGHAGQLSPTGVRQQARIAERMMANFPMLFADGVPVKARSSVSERCAKSMAAFIGRLRRDCPTCSYDVCTDSADMGWIAYTSPEQQELEAKFQPAAACSSRRLMTALFRRPAAVQEPDRLMRELYFLASDMQDVGLALDFYPFFTDAEFEALYEQNNRKMYLQNGTAIENNAIPARSAVSLWMQMQHEADSVLAVGRPAVSLRFGHDSSLLRLLSLLRLSREGQTDDKLDRMDEVLPMAANLQLLFCRSSVDAHAPVLVGFRLNEQPMCLQLPSVGGGQYYEWAAVKDYMHRRLDDLRVMEHLATLNTMVGTARANTGSAGLFGKGSEEHGQTLPAVLVPNGQNFWTPQTRDTERKGVAPYYYEDSLLQGFRQSHWIVGGATQDYGSFTVATLSGPLRLQTEQCATPFCHLDEESHPYEYRIHLPDEHLTTSLTALSHAAVLRVEPDSAGLVHLILRPNSDEGEGSVCIDTVHGYVYASNPVHRIYQGWGKSAGFSGHFVLTYPAAALVDFGVFTDSIVCDSGLQAGHRPRIGAWLTFRLLPHQIAEFRTASSFTSLQAALQNLEAELAGRSFDEVAADNVRQWTERFRTIDVQDADTALVRRFYGAFYRASFLPREFSDATAGRRYFTDFSMWDIYRALLPFYHLIVPELSGQLMQSLVDMYQWGGWLPIFPCWNSYTAAMIGDHCAAALADAYVKGVRNFDVETAYEAMRKNAFESPRSFAEYQDGMGRRALQSYLRYGYIPLEDSVKEAYHTCEQTSRTLEYAFDDYAVAQMARALGHEEDCRLLTARASNWRHVINPATGWADGRHSDGSWAGCTDLVHRQPFITEGTIAHYTWYVPHDVPGLIDYLGAARFESHLDSLFMPLTLSDAEGTVRHGMLYWHGNEPCHQVAYLYDFIGKPWKTQRLVRQILDSEYNNSPGGLSGNDDAGQLSAWLLFSSLGFYPVCPSTPDYLLGAPAFSRVDLHLPGDRTFTITAHKSSPADIYVQCVTLDGQPFRSMHLSHATILRGGHLHFDMGPQPLCD